MDDLRTRSGENFTWQRRVNLAVGGLTSLLLLVTVVSSFALATPPPTQLNVFLVLCIIMMCSSVAVLMFWYRRDGLDSKFLALIYYSVGLIVLLCLCANLYFHDVGR